MSLYRPVQLLPIRQLDVSAGRMFHRTHPGFSTAYASKFFPTEHLKNRALVHETAGNLTDVSNKPALGLRSPDPLGGRMAGYRSSGTSYAPGRGCAEHAWPALRLKITRTIAFRSSITTAPRGFLSKAAFSLTGRPWDASMGVPSSCAR